METQAQIDFWLFIYGLVSVTGFGGAAYVLWRIREPIMEIILFFSKLFVVGVAASVWLFCIFMTVKHWPK